ncbi:hypothetical protein DYB25_005970 [Aphanomyces astaci]|uniref:Uncharacterized protein n=2 Tax=Aphanomyces astaci TaxID=112090 RepID=A0A397ERL5_APHAT|nr:hypothetical protein DYB25_005970 [Aphanomyces astaci]RHY98290.1 hypothetical protein DYB31_001554 [Aphanomyces astaci]
MGNKALARSSTKPPSQAIPNQHASKTHVLPFDDGDTAASSKLAASEFRQSTDWRSDASDPNNEGTDTDNDDLRHKVVASPYKRMGSGTKVPAKTGESGSDSSDDDDDKDMARRLNTRNVTISSLKPSVDPIASTSSFPPVSQHDPHPVLTNTSRTQTKGALLAPLDVKSTQSFAHRKSIKFYESTNAASFGDGLDAVMLMALKTPPHTATDVSRGMVATPPATTSHDIDDLATMELINELMLESPKIESSKETHIREALVVTRQQRSAGKTTKGGIGKPPFVPPPYLDATDEDIMNQILQERRPGTTPIS